MRVWPFAIKDLAWRFLQSIWLFPVVLTIIVAALSYFGISGSSIGVYHNFFYGDQKDPALIFGEPRPIRSDEWLVNTQATIAQYQENYPRINHNIGLGQDMSVVVDVPYRDWSILFRPHNLGFFVLPFENAFALRWWLMGYLLILGCYFFVLALMPRQRLIAVGLSLALFFSAFVQWWYVYGTLGSLYYSFFIILTVMGILNYKNLVARLALGVLFAYLVASFVLVLYPPFQIPCALVTFVFLLGYLVSRWRFLGWPRAVQGLAIVILGLVVSATAVFGFIKTREDVVRTILATEYPGERVLESGGMPAFHFFSSHLGSQFLDNETAGQYLIDGQNPTNQSEASNFLMLAPFIFIPSLAIALRRRRYGKSIDWPLVFLNILFVVFLLQHFLPAFTPFSEFLFLHVVGWHRLLIGTGILSFIIFALTIRRILADKLIYPVWLSGGYAAIVFLFQLAVGIKIVDQPGDFLNFNEAVLFAIPFSLVVFFLLRRQVQIAVVIFALFAIFIGHGVNPLYRGFGVVFDTPLSQEIREIASRSDERWVSDGGFLTNIATINGARSLSSIYNYPQPELWRKIEGATEAIYDRYAHVGFQFSDNPDKPAQIQLVNQDVFRVTVHPCDAYLDFFDVGFLVTKQVLNAACLDVVATISKPTMVVYIYDRF